MRLQWATSLLAFVPGSRAFLRANQLCGTNKQCSSTCLDGQFHPAFDGRSVYFACSFSNEVSYHALICERTLQPDKVCEAAARKYCSSTKRCVVVDDDQKKYFEECEAQYGIPDGSDKESSYEEVLAIALCKN